MTINPVALGAPPAIQFGRKKAANAAQKERATEILGSKGTAVDEDALFLTEARKYVTNNPLLLAIRMMVDFFLNRPVNKKLRQGGQVITTYSYPSPEKLERDMVNSKNVLEKMKKLSRRAGATVEKVDGGCTIRFPESGKPTDTVTTAVHKISDTELIEVMQTSKRP